jgi:hypothetical protein
MNRVRIAAAALVASLLLIAFAQVQAADTESSKSARTIKWNPGHYMASYKVLYPDNTLADVQGELNDLRNQDAIVGYRVLIAWSALEDDEGKYTFSVLDDILNHLKTAYGKPKHMVVVVLPGAFHSSEGKGVPSYIQSSSVYGPSPLSGSYGWWGASPGAGAICAALWRPAVMARYAALLSAMGAHYDADPYFEAIMIQEDAWISSAGTHYSRSDFDSSVLISNLQGLLTTATAAFPHTSVIMQNTYMPPSDAAENFEQWMIRNRVAPGTADTVGQTAFEQGYANTNLGLAWGIQSYMGVTTPGGAYRGPDYRGKARAMLDVEAEELAGKHYEKWGATDGFTPLDIITAANQTYKASHLFWTHLFGNEAYPAGGIPAASKWANLAATCAANPLTNTSYPENYP